MKQGLYNRRVEALKKAKAEWQAKQAPLADDHPHKGASDHDLLSRGYQLAGRSHPAVSFIALAASISRLVGMVT